MGSEMCIRDSSHTSRRGVGLPFDACLELARLATNVAHRTPMCLVVALCVATLPPSLRDRPQSGQARVEVVTIVSTYTTFVGEYSYSWRADSKQKQTTNGRWPHLNTHVHTSDPHIHIRCILILYPIYISIYIDIYSYPSGNLAVGRADV